MNFFNKHFFIKVIFFLLIFNSSGILFGTDISKLSDETIIVSVGDFDITMGDFRFYIAGFGSITDVNSAHANSVLRLMIIDTLIKAECFNAKITISEAELHFYAQDFFDAHSIDLNDKKAYDLYFYMNDPYSSLQDFYTKSSFYLLKAKYLAKNNFIKSVSTRHIFFSTKGLDSKQQGIKKQLATQITNKLSSNMGDFKDFVQKYSDDKKSLSNNGDFIKVENSKKVQNLIGGKNIKRILSAGLFSPIFIETKDGYHIIENYEYKLYKKIDLIKLTEDLEKKYPVKQYVFFNEK